MKGTPYDLLTVWEWEGGAVLPDDETNLEDVAGFDRSDRGDHEDEHVPQSVGQCRPALLSAEPGPAPTAG